MVEAIVRSPASFFDNTPSGTLINKFSNDLGVIENTLIFSLIDITEGPIMTLVAIVSMTVINVYILVPAVIVFIVSVLFFIYARPAILQTK